MSKYVPAEVRDICAEQIETILSKGNAELFFTFMGRRWVLQQYTDRGILVDFVPGQVVRWMKARGRLVSARGPKWVLPTKETT